MHNASDTALLPKHQFSVTVVIEAPIERCFIAGSAEKDMLAWVPNCKSVVYDHSRASEPYGPGSSRTITVNNGTTFVENVLVSEKPHLFGYCIPSFGTPDTFIKRYQGRMVFESLDPNRTRLTWNGYFECPGWRRILEPLVRAVMRRFLATMAANIQRNLASEALQAKAA